MNTKRELMIIAMVITILLIFIASLPSHKEVTVTEPTEYGTPMIRPTEAEVEPTTEEINTLIYLEAYSVEPEPESLGVFKITHYCACTKCCEKDPTDEDYGITATGTVATEGRTIAVDPKVIPYGSEVLVKYEDGTEATYIAEDCGGAIKSNRIDVFMKSHKAAWDAGVRMAEVFIIGE